MLTPLTPPAALGVAFPCHGRAPRAAQRAGRRPARKPPLLRAATPLCTARVSPVARTHAHSRSTASSKAKALPALRAGLTHPGIHLGNNPRDSLDSYTPASNRAPKGGRLTDKPRDISPPKIGGPFFCQGARMHDPILHTEHALRIYGRMRESSG